MNQHGGLVHFAFEQLGQSLEGAFNTLVDCNALVQHRLFEYPGHHFGFDAGVANTQAKSPVLVRTQLCVDVPQAVVTGVAAAKFKFRLAWNDVHIVMHDQNQL